jgi:hypothetical protein
MSLAVRYPEGELVDRRQTALAAPRPTPCYRTDLYPPRRGRGLRGLRRLCLLVDTGFTVHASIITITMRAMIAQMPYSACTPSNDGARVASRIECPSDAPDVLDMTLNNQRRQGPHNARVIPRERRAALMSPSRMTLVAAPLSQGRHGLFRPGAPITSRRCPPFG